MRLRSYHVCCVELLGAGMNIEYLESFVRVVECQSIAEAARRLDVTPGAVSARVRGLEEELGVTLIQRSGHTVKPTPAGMRVYDHGRALIQQARDLHAIAVSDTVSGELRIGLFPSALTTHLPPLLERFCPLFPDLAIHVSFGLSAELCRKVHEGELDLAVVIEPPFAIQKNCEWSTLQQEPLVVIAPLAMQGRQAHDLLLNEPFIRYDRGVYTGKLVDRYLKDQRIIPAQRLEIDSLLTIVSLVERGVGVSLVPDSFAMDCQAPKIAKIALPGRPPSRCIGVIWARQGPRAATAVKLVEQAQALFAAGVAGRPRRSATCPEQGPVAQ